MTKKYQDLFEGKKDKRNPDAEKAYDHFDSLLDSLEALADEVEWDYGTSSIQLKVIEKTISNITASRKSFDKIARKL